MNDHNLTQYEKVLEIAQNLGKEIEEIRRINANDISSLTQEELSEIQNQIDDD